MGNNERDPMRIGEYAQAHANTPLQLKHARSIVRAVTESIGEHIEARLATLIARIEKLESKPSIEYCGVFEPGRAYTPGNAITAKGSLWICTEATSSPPSFDGASAGWQLAAKKGRDASSKDRAA